MKSFDTRDEVRCLLSLGYKKAPQVGSRHLKYVPPADTNKTTSMPPFMLIMQGKKDVDPKHQKNFIRDLKRHGFSDDQIKEAMWG